MINLKILMSYNFTEKEKQEILEKYNNGMSIRAIANYNYTKAIHISDYLKTLGIDTSNKKRGLKYTEKDIAFIRQYYPDGNWDMLFEYFNVTNKQIIHNLASRHNIKSNYHTWTKEKEQILLDNLYKKSWEEISILLNNEYSISAISTKAAKLGYKAKTRWTNEETQILIDYYENTSLDDVCKMLPNRNRKSIINKAMKLGIKSPDRNLWSKKEDQYILSNWETKPDCIMAEELNRTFRSVKWRREYLGLFRQDKNDKNYDVIGNYLRRNTTSWKNNSMKECDYRCVITGSKDFEVHHYYPVNMIIKDILQKLQLPYKKFKDYSEEELLNILNEFKIEQDKELGVCIDKKLHKLFHKLYGFNNNKEQFIQFSIDFRDGRYDELIKET